MLMELSGKTVVNTYLFCVKIKKRDLLDLILHHSQVSQCTKG